MPWRKHMKVLSASNVENIDSREDETRRDQWLACLTSKELSFAGDLAYWNYGLNELVTSSSASRTSSRVQLKQLELNHRWSHGMSQLSVFSLS